jgi:uncharacterized protein YpmS
MIKKLIMTLIFMTALTTSQIGFIYLMMRVLDKRESKKVVAAEKQKAHNEALNDTNNTDESLERTIVAGFRP